MNENIPGYTDVMPPSKEVSEALMLLKPYVRQAGDDLRGLWFVKERKLFDYMLLYLEKKSVIMIDNEIFHTEKEELFLVPPNTVHRMEGENNKLGRCIYIHFDLIYDSTRSHWDASIPGGICDLSRWSNFIHPKIENDLIKKLHGRIELQSCSKVISLMSEICRVHREQNNRGLLRLSGMMLELISEFLNSKLYLEKRHKHLRVILESEKYIKEHLFEDINFNLMAKNLGFSASHFRKLFRDIHTFGPRTFQRRHRIIEAAKRLTYSNKNVSEIAEETGFSTVHNFSRAFKDIMGISPSNYKAVL